MGKQKDGERSEQEDEDEEEEAPNGTANGDSDGEGGAEDQAHEEDEEEEAAEEEEDTEIVIKAKAAAKTPPAPVSTPGPASKRVKMEVVPAVKPKPARASKKEDVPADDDKKAEDEEEDDDATYHDARSRSLAASSELAARLQATIEEKQRELEALPTNTIDEKIRVLTQAAAVAAASSSSSKKKHAKTKATAKAHMHGKSALHKTTSPTPTTTTSKKTKGKAASVTSTEPRAHIKHKSKVAAVVEHSDGVKPIRKKHRYHPGTVALREIRRLQRSTDFLVPRLPLERLVREIGQNSGGPFQETGRFTHGAIEALRTAAEAYLTTCMEEAYLITIHGRRVTLAVRDLRLRQFLNKELPTSSQVAAAALAKAK